MLTMEWMILPLKRYADFNGRSRRMEYWMFALFQFLLYLVLFAIMLGVAGGTAAMSGGGTNGAVGLLMSMGVLAIFMVVIWLGLIIPALAVAIRRLHDTDRSGWWLLVYVIPYVIGTVVTVMGSTAQSGGLALLGGLFSLIGLIGALVLFVFTVSPGTPGPNRFGPDPKAGDPIGAKPATY
jgi:uncharacterized membrane protein YhaH (DUF805 family)